MTALGDITRVRVKPSYVAKTSGQVVRIELGDDAISEELERSGFTFRDGGYEIVAVTDIEMAIALSRLSDLKLPMARGLHPNPGQTFRRLRRQGLIAGTFREIAILRSGEWVVFDLEC